jgi:tRNA-uridine 2-sulfurtransferase
MEKVIVMFSGGLDSRLVVKIMQEQGLEVVALFFNLPFGTGCCDEGCSFNFAQLHGLNLKVIDCTKGDNLKKYLDVIRKPLYNRGSGINPCVDCRLFLFKKAKEFADKEGIEMIVSGEVLGERPMSQMRKSMRIIEEESGLKGRLLRPLSAKLMDETIGEKKGYIDRSKLYSIHGRQRIKQIAMAKKFNINYPTPAGGCLLCEKALSRRFLTLLERELTADQMKILEIGRHFIIDNAWVTIGRDLKENQIIEAFGKEGEVTITEGFPGPASVIFDKVSSELREKVKKLVLAYSKKGSLKERAAFEEYKL